MKAIRLYISNAFNKVRHRVLLHKLFTYATPGSIFAMILSFLSGRSINFIFNAHSCEFGINLNQSHLMLSRRVYFSCYIYKISTLTYSQIISKYIQRLYHRLLAHIQKSIIAKLGKFSEQAEITQQRNNWLVLFNRFKIQLIMPHLHREDCIFLSHDKRFCSQIGFLFWTFIGTRSHSRRQEAIVMMK